MIRQRVQKAKSVFLGGDLFYSALFTSRLHSKPPGPPRLSHGRRPAGGGRGSGGPLNQGERQLAQGKSLGLSLKRGAMEQRPSASEGVTPTVLGRFVEDPDETGREGTRVIGARLDSGCYACDR